MDLDPDEIQSLFGEEREERTVDDIEEFHLGVDIRANGVCIYTDNEQYVLTEAEKEALLDHIDADTIWDVLSEKFKVLDYLQ